MTTISIEEFCQALSCAFTRAGDLKPGADDRIAFISRQPKMPPFEVGAA